MHATVESTLTTQLRVLNALMLRDMRTRFGRSHWGFLIAVGWPFAHVFVVVAIMVARGLPTPLGHSTTLFATTGLIPFIGFTYMSRKVMESMMSNKPLLFFPQVKSTDIILSRCFLEMFIFMCSVILCMILLFLLGIDPIPVNPEEAIFGLLATVLFSIGLGSVNACIVMFFPGYSMGYVLIVIGLYSLSGAFFVPEFLPKQIYDILTWNPLLHCVTWFRSGYYAGYGASAEKTFVIMTGALLLATGFLADRFLVRKFGN